MTPDKTTDNNRKPKKIGYMHKTFTILADELKRNVQDKRIVAILFVHAVLVLMGANYGVILGRFAKILFIQTTIPVELAAPYYISAAVFPVLAILLSFDLVAGEISANTMGYLVVRAKRSSIILSKYLASAAALAAASLVAYSAAIIYISIKTGREMIGTAALIWLYLLIYSLVFLSLGILCSTIAKKHQTALWAAVSVAAVWLLASSKESIASLTPFHYVNYILQGDAARGMAAFAIFAAAGLAASMLAFERKDI